MYGYPNIGVADILNINLMEPINVQYLKLQFEAGTDS